MSIGIVLWALFAATLSAVSCQEDELINFINPLDLEIFSTDETSTAGPPSLTANNETDPVDCFGFTGVTSRLRWVLNMRPQHRSEIPVDFFFSSRSQRKRVQVVGGDQFGLEWVSYNPNNPTVVIVHGFLSYSGASWVVNMTNAFLDWDDVNVIAVDWSRGGNTWKYWRAVANTRTVGSELASLLEQLIKATGTDIKKFHFVGHSLGAHICSFASQKLGGVRRITGLDPAQPCFVTTDLDMLLDKSDADFVDVIHTNGRVIAKIGLGVPNTCGDQDFYPNGGMKQPGCHTGKPSFFSKWLPISRAKLIRAMCNHGRAYLLFTESLKKHNCTLHGHSWDLSYNSINSSMRAPCPGGGCPELGIRADLSPARGSFYVVTTAKSPYCNETQVKHETRDFLLTDFEEEMTEEPSTTTTKKPKKWIFF